MKLFVKRPKLQISHTPMTIPDVKYDRQIRLFGEDVQRKLQQMKVQILAPDNLTSLEIVKNLALLGIGTIIINSCIEKSIRNIIPDGLEAINNSLKIEFSDKKVVAVDFTFFVNTVSEAICELSGHAAASNMNLDKKPTFYYVCTDCKIIKLNTYEHVCEKSSSAEADLFLLGALAVQEFLKILQNKNYKRELKLEY